MALTEVKDPSRVLLIEDSPDDEALALRALRSCGRPLAVRVARDGFRARSLLGLDDEFDEFEHEVPQAVISDLKLPGFDGHDLLCMARQDPRLAEVPFVIFSSSNELEDVNRCLSCGADAYAQKPVDYQDYLTCLRSLVHWVFDGFSSRDFPLCVTKFRTPHGAPRRAA